MHPIVVGNITIDIPAKQAFIGSEQLHLTPNESKILCCLAQNQGKLVTQETLRREVWGSEARYVDASTLKRYIYQLRMKLGDDGTSPRLILNEHGIGYRLAKP